MALGSQSLSSWWRKKLSKLRRTKNSTKAETGTLPPPAVTTSALTTTIRSLSDTTSSRRETSVDNQDIVRTNKKLHDCDRSHLFSPLSSQSSAWTLPRFKYTDDVDVDTVVGDGRNENHVHRHRIKFHTSQLKGDNQDDILHRQNEPDASQDSVPQWAVDAWFQVEDVTSKWLNKYVINTSSDGEWHFRTLFVAEVSILPFVLAFFFITTWVLNRNTHIRKTKGSTIITSNRAVWGYNYIDDDDDVDNEDSDDINRQGSGRKGSERAGPQSGYPEASVVGEEEQDAKQHRRKSGMIHARDSTIRNNKLSKKRQSIQAKLQSYSVERDDDHTLVSIPDVVEEEESDFEDESGFTLPSDQRIVSSKLFLSQEKKEIWKIVKGKIPIFSYFNQHAMQMCIENFEYVDLKKRGDSLWKADSFDGSLYYVVNGKVRVHFHNFKNPESEDTSSNNHDMILTWPNQPDKVTSTSIDHEAGTVVTSLLALCEGMVQAHLRDLHHPLARFVGKTLTDTSAYAMEDDTKLLKVPSSCFSKIMDTFPGTALRVLQTVLSRTQRVTVQILVKACGLRRELIRLPSSNLSSLLKPKKEKLEPWKWVSDFLDKRICDASDLDELATNDRSDLTLNACRMFGSILGVDDESSIEVLHEQCSVAALPSRQANGKPTVLLETGSSQNACYMLLKGRLELGMFVPVTGATSMEVNNEPTWVFKCFEEVEPGGLIGEDAAFTTDVHMFEVRCSSSPDAVAVNVVLKVPIDVFSRFITKHPSAMSLSLGKMMTMLGPPVHLLSWTSEVLHIEAAKEIVKKNERCDALFVVLNGRLRASNRSESHRRVLESRSSDVIPPEEYGRGKIIGEVGALAGKPWPFEVFAIRQSELARVPIRTLEVLAQNFPSAGISLARSVAANIESLYFSRRNKVKFPFQGMNPDNLGNNTAKIPQSHSLQHQKPTAPNTLPSYGLSLATIAVVPLTYNVDVKKFCVSLTNSMQSIAPTKLLTKSFMRESLGERVYTTRNALHDLKMTRFLADLEENNRLVIYQADHKYTFWTRLCVRQADRILLLVDATNAPEKNRIEQSLEWVHESMDVQIDLVVVGEPIADEISEEDQDDDILFANDDVNNWSESRQWISGHHLVRKPFDRYRNDFHRMSRRVTGRSVGLVLGGGGARGIAHLGIIRALVEAGVTVDLVGGTSQGAFVGALYAQNPDSYDEVERATKAMATQMASIWPKIFDLTLPLSSIFTGRSFNRGIRKLLGKMRIQDLVLNFFCTSVDLQKQCLVVHTKGLLWKYVRASMSLTGYLPPIAEDDSLLVDGGYLNAVPADVMRFKMGARTVIAVDVSPESQRSYYQYGTEISGWWLLLNSWNPFATTVRVPSMGDIQELLVWVSSEQHRKAVAAVSDLHLTPPVSQYNTLEYEKFSEIDSAGYEYAKPIIDEWVKQNPWLVTSNKHSSSPGKKNKLQTPHSF